MPTGGGIYYECLDCSVIVNSVPHIKAACACGNLEGGGGKMGVQPGARPGGQGQAAVVLVVACCLRADSGGRLDGALVFGNETNYTLLYTQSCGLRNTS